MTFGTQHKFIKFISMCKKTSGELTIINITNRGWLGWKCGSQPKLAVTGTHLRWQHAPRITSLMLYPSKAHVWSFLGGIYHDILLYHVISAIFPSSHPAPFKPTITAPGANSGDATDWIWRLKLLAKQPTPRRWCLVVGQFGLVKFIMFTMSNYKGLWWFYMIIVIYL